MRWFIVLVSCLLTVPALAAEVEERPELAKLLKDAGVTGVVAMLDPQSGTITVSDRALAARQSLPASTFKVPAALIALDTGVVKDAQGAVFKQDWPTSSIKACNADQTLATALARSCVPVFAKIGRMIGDEKLTSALKVFEYGNAKATGGYPYWLAGDLRISPLEQIAFIDKLRRQDLPVSQSAMNAVTEIIEIDRTDTYVLRGKTGWAGAKNPDTGWFVGWAEKGDDVRVFAVNIEMTDIADAPKRLAIAKQMLDAASIKP